MLSNLNHFFDPSFDFVTYDLLVMLGMFVGHVGDVENDAGDVDGLV